MSETLEIPPGFAAIKMRANPYIEACGPLYGRLEGADTLVLGLRVQARHCNPGLTCHGGMVMTFADMTLILGASVQTQVGRYHTTVNLSGDFIAPAPLGAWIEGRCNVLRASKNLVFCEGRISHEGAVVARISGILKPVGEADPAWSSAAYFEA